MFGPPNFKFRKCSCHITTRFPALISTAAAMLLSPGDESSLVFLMFIVEKHLKLIYDHCPEAGQCGCLVIP